MEELKQRIRKVLEGRSPKKVKERGGLVRAAVLVPLFYEARSPHVLFIKRTETVTHHKGEISFPGGTRDPEDEDLLRTALRETHEEIGVKPEDVEVVGELDEIVTMSDFLVTPFVGFIPYPYPFRLNPTEIEELVPVPLEAFLWDERWWKEKRRYGKKEREVFIYQWGPHQIWGATARIMRGFLELLFPRESLHR